MNTKYFFYGLGIAAVIGAIVYYLFLKPSEAATTTEEDSSKPLVNDTAISNCPRESTDNGGFCEFSENIKPGKKEIWNYIQIQESSDGWIMLKLDKSYFKGIDILANKAGKGYLIDSTLFAAKLFQSKYGKFIVTDDTFKMIIDKKMPQKQYDNYTNVFSLIENYLRAKKNNQSYLFED